MIRGVETEIAENSASALAHSFDLVFRPLALDFDERAGPGDRVERNRVLLEPKPLSLLPYRRNGVESEPPESRVHCVAIPDPSLYFLSCLRGRLDQRPLVRESRHGVVIGRFLASDTECFVGPGEVTIRVVVVGVDLRDGVEWVGPEFPETFAHGAVVGSHFQLDLVHATIQSSDRS